jgi:hypothetical protein
MKMLFLLCFMLLCVNSVRAQTQMGSLHPCTVAVADFKSGRILKTISFKTIGGEEELTNRTFRIPSTRLIVTASVFYTDESMASNAGFDSMRLGLSVSRKAQSQAFGSPNNAVAEITLNTFDTAQVYTNTYVNGRHLLVLMECRNGEQERKASEKDEEK